MRAAVDHYLRCLALLIPLGAACGCAEFRNPFAKQRTGSRMETPADRVERLRELADRADALPPLEKERTSQTLAEQLPHEPDALVRMELLRTLGSLNASASLAAMHAGLTDPDEDVRVVCCEAWGRRGGPEATAALTGVLESDESNDVKLAAARALGESRDPAAIAALGAMLEHNNPALQYRAVVSLEKITHQDFGGDVNRWREYVQSGNHSVREESVADKMRNWF